MAKYFSQDPGTFIQKTSRFVFLIVLVCQPSLIIADDYNLFTVSSGRVIGRVFRKDPTGSTISFYSIPYATYDERFGYSSSINENNFSSHSNKFSPYYCPSFYIAQYLKLKNEVFKTQTNVGEDCLSLDVYVNRNNLNNEKLTPVIVLFDDPKSDLDSFTSEYSSTVLHLLKALDAVIIKVNYRNGPLGFLNLGEDPYLGNYGVADQKIALEWVQTNAQVFAGNANQVVVLGQGLGAVGLGWHLKNAASLFRRYIALSGTPMSFIAEMNSEKFYSLQRSYIGYFGCDRFKSLQYCLEDVSADDLYLKTSRNTLVNEIFVPRLDFENFVQSTKSDSTSRDALNKRSMIGMLSCGDGMNLHGSFVESSSQFLSLVSSTISGRIVDHVKNEYDHHHVNLSAVEEKSAEMNMLLTDFFISSASFRFASLLPAGSTFLFAVGSGDIEDRNCFDSSDLSMLGSKFLDWPEVRQRFKEFLQFEQTGEDNLGSMPLGGLKKTLLTDSSMDSSDHTASGSTATETVPQVPFNSSHFCVILNPKFSPNQNNPEKSLLEANFSIANCEPHIADWWNRQMQEYNTDDSPGKIPTTQHGTNTHKSTDIKKWTTDVHQDFDSKASTTENGVPTTDEETTASVTSESLVVGGKKRSGFENLPFGVYCAVGVMSGFLLALLTILCCLYFKWRCKRSLKRPPISQCTCSSNHVSMLHPGVPQEMSGSVYAGCNSGSCTRLIPMVSGTSVFGEYDEIYGGMGRTRKSSRPRSVRASELYGQGLKMERTYSDVRTQSPYAMIPSSNISNSNQKGFVMDTRRPLSQPVLAMCDQRGNVDYPWLITSPRLAAVSQQQPLYSEERPPRETSGAESPSVESSGYGGGDGSRCGEARLINQNGKPVVIASAANQYFMNGSNHMFASDVSSTDLTDALLNGHYNL